MHTEVQVALKFVISFLYNKLPRRRVNLFGEELDHALKDKFQGHWYPDKPFKGSAYRCLKITDPADPVLNRAARESGNPLSDIIENLPADLAVWIDPGEVSYRIGEKGSVKILYSEKDSSLNLEDINPDVRGFLSLDTVTASLNGLSLSQQSSYSGGSASPQSAPISPPIMAANTSPPAVNYPPNPFQPRQMPVVYTAASFAQTKFGSTKLKTNSKKPNRMSPTEFSNYIKQRALQKSIQQQQQQQQHYSGSQSPGPYQDKFYGQNGYYYGNNPTNSNFNFNNFPKSGGGLNSNDLGFMMGGGSGNQNQLSPTPSSAGNQNHLSPSPGPALNLSDYSNLFTDWDNETEANAFLQDILSSAGEVPRPTRQLSTGFEDWLSSATASHPLGFNANQESTGLGPESRSSSTKSMSSVSDSPAAAATPAANSDGGFNQRVLVAN